MTTTPAGERFGPVQLMPGVRRRHVLAYLWAAFVSIGIFTYATTLQPFLLEVNLGVPPARRGAVSGDLQFWQEVVALVLVGLYAPLTQRPDGWRVAPLIALSPIALAWFIRARTTFDYWFPASGKWQSADGERLGMERNWDTLVWFVAYLALLGFISGLMND